MNGKLGSHELPDSSDTSSLYTRLQWFLIRDPNISVPTNSPFPPLPPPTTVKTMLSSSDAKWRCMWHMLVWSVALTLVSQFLLLTNFIAFYILAAITMIFLPVITAVYNNTSGKHGAGLLRVAYVFCDPVMACITVVPLLIFNHLPSVIAEYECIQEFYQWNATYWCMKNHSDIDSLLDYEDITSASYSKQDLVRRKKGMFLIIQASLFIPALLCLFMGRRSRKMTFNTHLLTFIYWLVASIEAADLLDYSLMNHEFVHIINTTEAIVAIVRIITHSYAVVTLCSYISPMQEEIDREFQKKFDFLYQIFIAISGVLFTEIPLLVARVQIIAVDVTLPLPGPFYMWMVKDLLFTCLLVILLVGQKIAQRKSARVLCKINLDTPNVVFQPEKRDAYIVKKKSVRFKEPLSTTFDFEEHPPPLEHKDKKPFKWSAYFHHSHKTMSHDTGLNHVHKKKSKWKEVTSDTDAETRHREKVNSNPELSSSTAPEELSTFQENNRNDQVDSSADSLA